MSLGSPAGLPGAHAGGREEEDRCDTPRPAEAGCARRRRHRMRLAAEWSSRWRGAAPGLAPAGSRQPRATQQDSAGNGCHLGHGIKHVVEIDFDNVHFFRDNPNVPSDLQMMPNLLHFFEDNGTFLSNSHTPLIAHTADDLLTTATGLYGDRQGMPVSNDYQAYNTDGTTDPASSFAYWTDPIFDTASTAEPGPRHQPVHGVLGHPARHHAPAPKPDTTTPAPWVPFTRAGCNVGDVSTVNQVLENTAVDIPKVFGANSPEAQQLAADPDSFKDAETADYVGLGRALRQGQRVLRHRRGGQVRPDQAEPHRGHRPAARRAGRLHRLPGPVRPPVHRAAARRGHAEPDRERLPGDQRRREPGRPEREPDQRRVPDQPPRVPRLRQHQRLADPGLHGRHAGRAASRWSAGTSRTSTATSTSPACRRAPARPTALGSGEPCYVAQAQYYNQAFGTFFKRLAADGITAKNTLFVLSSDEGDHEAGANVGRAIAAHPGGLRRRHGQREHGDPGRARAPTRPARSASWPATSPGCWPAQKNNTVPFSLENDTAPEFYVTGNPGPNDPAVRTPGTRRGRAHRGQPVHRYHPEDRQLPGRPGRGSHPAHGERRPGPDADVRHVRQTRLLPAVLGARPGAAPGAGVPEHRLRLGSRRLRGGDQHQLRSASPAPGSSSSGWTARRRRQGPSSAGRQQRPGHRTRAAAPPGPGWTRPTSGRR